MPPTAAATPMKLRRPSFVRLVSSVMVLSFSCVIDAMYSGNRDAIGRFRIPYLHADAGSLLLLKNSIWRVRTGDTQRAALFLRRAAWLRAICGPFDSGEQLNA